jgi:hypothetical protein
MRRPAVVLGTSGLLALAALGAPPAMAASDYTAGDNPMCVQDTSGATLACLEASRVEAVSGATITFSADPTIYPPGRWVCLGRATKPYGTYQRVAACTRVNKDGTASIRAILRQAGAAWYDLGDDWCLSRSPATRPPKRCGDNGGVQSTPVQVTIR